MKTYMLMHKDIVVSLFKIYNSEVTKWLIPKSRIAVMHMPLPLKRIVHYIHGGYIKDETDKSYSINEEGRYYLENWLSDRAIPANRENIEQYVKNKNSIELMLKSHSCSLTDCYWTKSTDENTLNWSSIKLYNSDKIDYLEVVNTRRENGETYSQVNSTLGGCLEKYWYYSYAKNKKDSRLMLAKRTTINNDILSIREIIASKIYEKQGYSNYCKYKYIRNSYGQIVGCKCKAFTSDKLELITAYDLLEEYAKTQVDDIYNTIIKLACNYGANYNQLRNQLDIQTLVDYIITNRDRHQNNIGFLRNPDTLEIITIAPIFDSGSSAEMEWQLPLGVENTTVHNLHYTEIECLMEVRDLHIMNLSRLPSDNWIKQQLSKMNNGNEMTVEKYMRLYKAKVQYIRNLQSR